LFLVSDDSFYFWGVAPIPKQAKKDSFLSLLFLFFSQLAQAQKSSAGNFIESISCRGSAVPFGKNKHNTLKIYLFAIVYNL
jgi:hypothetical protein